MKRPNAVHIYVLTALASLLFAAAQPEAATMIDLQVAELANGLVDMIDSEAN